MADIKKTLGLLLADYQVLYQKLRGYHWNVTGPQFFTLHAFFETEYIAVADRVDLIAERVRALGGTPPSTLKLQLDLARLKEDPTVPTAEGMVRNLVADYDVILAALLKASDEADDAEDVITENMLEDFISVQRKACWMMRSFLNEAPGSDKPKAKAKPKAKPKAKAKPRAKK
jgi:starvation-inducible DNA-binding protein